MKSEEFATAKKRKPKEVLIKQYPHGFNPGFWFKDVCPAITISSWQANNFLVEIYDDDE